MKSSMYVNNLSILIYNKKWNIPEDELQLDLRVVLFFADLQ